MNVLAIDPGTHDSAFVVYDGQRPTDFGIESNSAMLTRLHTNALPVVCEMLACQGMPVGLETFETAYFIGQVMAAQLNAGRPFYRVYRGDVKMHLCGSMKAKDPNIRQALLDKWGGKDQAIGRKNLPGPLYKLSRHAWSALAVAVTFCESEKFTQQRMSA